MPSDKAGNCLKKRDGDKDIIESGIPAATVERSVRKNNMIEEKI